MRKKSAPKDPDKATRFYGILLMILGVFFSAITATVNKLLQIWDIHPEKCGCKLYEVKISGWEISFGAVAFVAGVGLIVWRQVKLIVEARSK